MILLVASASSCLEAYLTPGTEPDPLTRMVICDEMAIREPAYSPMCAQAKSQGGYHCHRVCNADSFWLHKRTYYQIRAVQSVRSLKISTVEWNLSLCFL